MENKLYFWKRQKTPGKRMGAFIGMVILILTGSAVGFYYLHYVPHREMEKKRKAEKAAFELKIKQVNDFYLDKLSGGSIDKLTDLMTEMYKSDIPLNQTGYRATAFSCDKNSCSFGYFFNFNAIFNLQKKVFWNDVYSAIIGENDVSFSEVPSRMDMNPLLEKYNSNEKIYAPDCSVILSYLYTYNSVAEDKDKIVIVEQPSSSVSDAETAIKGRKKYYGLLFSSWAVKTDYDLSHIMSLFERQAFRDDFIIKSINLNSGLVNISGDFVCKGGS